MKKMLCPVLVSLFALSFASGCATYSKYGKKEVNVLGGLVKVEGGEFPRMGPLTISEPAETFDPQPDYDGDSLSLLWGFIVIADR